MVGRIEIVTPEQRRLLAKIASDAGGVATAAAPADLSFEEQVAAMTKAPSFQVYKQLGRFRMALVLDELKRAPTPALQQFSKDYRLATFKTSANNAK